MKIRIIAYIRKNLGDDLFIKILLDKYKNVDFYINSVNSKYTDILEQHDNLTVIKEQEENFNHMQPTDYDAYIYIGGSIFMENGKVYNLDNGCRDFIKKCYDNNIPFFYVSSNFGPYQTQEYFKLAQETFKVCKDICFRDKCSYQLFQDIQTVRYAPDLVFSLPEEKVETIENTIGISVIDLSIRKELEEKEKEYIAMISHNIMQYIDKGNEVYLFTFCEEEGDELALEKILEDLSKSYKQNVKVIKYNGDLEEYLNIYKKMEYMICARFHAMILSYIYKQKFYVTSYSKKMDNVIEELNLCRKENYCQIEHIKKDMLINKEKFAEVEEANLVKIRKEAQKQLLKIDEFINTNK